MSNLTITAVERTWVSVPTKTRPSRALIPEHWRWTVFEILRLRSDSALVGIGETMVYYTWGCVPEEQANRVIGRSPFDLLWDDRLGAGLQMAVFDLAGKAAGVPIHRLLGQQARPACPLSWWCNDMSGEDWAAEMREALSLGYRDAKLKARPWRDVAALYGKLAGLVPADFRFDADFNAFLRDTSTALPYLRQLAEIPAMHLFESPIPQEDVQGNALLRQEAGRPIAMHFGNPPAPTALREGVCDGFVIGGGAQRVAAEATVAAQFNKPFFLQMVGTGLTTAFMLHFGAVLTHATWPAITCLNTYTDDLLAAPITLSNGFAPVPEGPGLGVELDEEAVARYRVEPNFDPPAPRLLYRVSWPSGAEMFYTPGWKSCWGDFQAGNQPLFSPGVRLEALPDDGSAEWTKLYERALQAPVRGSGKK